MAQLTAPMIAFPGGYTSNVFSMTSPIAPIKPGTRARDVSGNEYVFCDYTATVYAGVCVVISGDGNFTAQPLTSSDHGAVGIVAGQATSDQGGWVQIYGYNAAVHSASATTGVTSAYVPIAASSVSSPATGINFVAATSSDQPLIDGMFVTGAGTSGSAPRVAASNTLACARLTTTPNTISAAIPL